MNFTNKLQLNISKRLASFILVGFSTAVVLIASTNSLVAGNIFNKGPQLAVAQECVNGVCPEVAPPPSISCTEDVEYCDSGIIVHKHGGRAENGQCVYAFDVTGISCGQTAPAPQPAPQPAPPTPPAAPVCAANTGQYFISDSVCRVHNCGGDSSVVADSNCGITHPTVSVASAPAPEQVQVQAQTQTQSTQVINNNSNINTVAANATALQTVYTQPQVVYTQPQTIYAQPIVRFATAESNCPTNYARTVNSDGSVTCTAPTPRVVTVAGAQEVKELPKTGLPLAAWALMGLLPIGSKFKSFGSEKDNLVTANSIWEDRQFKK